MRAHSAVQVDALCEKVMLEIKKSHGSGNSLSWSSVAAVDVPPQARDERVFSAC